jgi:flagellar hook-associated protein 2
LQSIGGLATGLDTNAIIKALVDAERALENPIKAQGQLAQIKLQAYSLIRNDLDALNTTALTLSHPADWRVLSAKSSNENAATVTAGSGTFGGTLTFTVDRLAAAGSVRSANTISNTSTAIAANATMFVAAGGQALGFSTLSSDAALTTAEHTIEVTQASSAATKNGSGALASSTLIDGTNDTLNVTVNGAAKVLTLAHGTYTAAQLASAVQDAATSAGAAVSATVLGSGKLQLATTREGSAATVQVTGGNALTDLKLTTDASANTGVDGKVSVDAGAAQTFSSLDPGGTVTLNAASGSISAVLSGGLRTGKLTGENVSTGDGSLATVIANINNAGVGVTATAVQVAAGAYRLQITSNTAGANNDQNIAASAFNDAVGGLTTLTTAADSQITVGDGPGAYTVSSATNTVSGLLPGVTVNLVAKSTDPITITVSRDDAGLADKVQKLVDALNQAQSTIDGLTLYDPQAKQAPPLTGDSAAYQLLSSLTRAVTNAVSTATPASPGLAGISIDAKGKFTFDKSKFTAAFAANPEGVAKLFSQSGSSTASTVQFVSAGARAVAGTYAINVTQLAQQGNDTGLTGSWPPASLPTVKVRVGTREVSYVVKDGDTRADVAAGLNAAFAGAGLALQASDTGSGLKVATNAYGSTAKFDVDWDGSGYVSHAGLDVAGTIGGVTATGSGQQLIVPFSDSTMSGLAVNITGNATGNLGPFTYEPGVAQRIQTAGSGATDLVTGYITSSETNLKAQIKFVDDQVDQMELRVTAYETMIRAQWAALESTISTMKSQSSFLSSQISSSTGSNSG